MADPNQLPGDEEYNLHHRLLEKFGQDFSPEARAVVEQRANERKNSVWAQGGNLLAGLGDVVAGRDADLEGGAKKFNDQVDAEETGKFDADKERVVKDYLRGQMDVDRARKQTKENTDYSHAQTEYADENEPDSMLSGIARDAAKDIGLKTPDDASFGQLNKVKDWLLKKKELEARRSAQQWGPADAEYLATIGDIARGVLPTNAPLPTEGVTPKALQAGGQRLGAKFGSDRTENRSRRLRGKPLEEVTGLASVLRNADSITMDAPGWDTGFLKNKVQRGLWYAGLDDPQRASVKARLARTLSEYVKNTSGLAVNEAEFKRLEAAAPTPEDDEDTLFAKLAEFKNATRRMLANRLDTSKKSEYDVQDFEDEYKGLGWLDEEPTLAMSPQNPAMQNAAPPGPPGARRPGGLSIRRKSDGKVFRNVPPERAQTLLQSGEAEEIR